jgi:hypothetical protein
VACKPAMELRERARHEVLGKTCLEVPIGVVYLTPVRERYTAYELISPSPVPASQTTHLLTRELLRVEIRGIVELIGEDGVVESSLASGYLAQLPACQHLPWYSLVKASTWVS